MLFALAFIIIIIIIMKSYTKYKKQTSNNQYTETGLSIDGPWRPGLSPRLECHVLGLVGCGLVNITDRHWTQMTDSEQIRHLYSNKEQITLFSSAGATLGYKIDENNLNKLGIWPPQYVPAPASWLLTFWH